MTKYANWKLPAFDLLVGGTPCQSFSVAGLRKGLSDPRGELALVYLGILDRFRPRWVVWENVPGVLSSNGGRDFGSFLGALGELGYGWAYRVLDAQFVRVESHPRAVPQRRHRVFVVGHSGGDWHSAAQVLLEPEGVRGDSAPRRKTGKGFAAVTENGPRVRRAEDASLAEEVAGCLPDPAYTVSGRSQGSGRDSQGPYFIVNVEHALHASNNENSFILRDLSETITSSEHKGHSVVLGPMGDGTGRGTPPFAQEVATSHLDPTAYGINSDAIDRSGEHKTGTAATRSGLGITHEVQPTIKARPTNSVAIAPYGNVRRLTPRECERLQGFPENYTLISYRGKPATDGNRYRALGNSMAVNVMRFIGERIHRHDPPV